MTYIYIYTEKKLPEKSIIVLASKKGNFFKWTKDWNMRTTCLVENLQANSGGRHMLHVFIRLVYDWHVHRASECV